MFFGYQDNLPVPAPLLSCAERHSIAMLLVIEGFRGLW